MKKVFLSLLTVFMVLSLSVVLVKAESETTIALKDGVQIRTDEKAGLKWVATLSNPKEEYKYGFLFAKGEVTDLTVETLDVENKVVEGVTAESATIAATMTKFPKAAVAQDITVRAYFYDGTNYTYTDPVVRNLAEVGVSAYEGGEKGKFVSNVVDYACVNFSTQSDGTIHIGSGLSELNLSVLEQEFVSDWNNKFSTSWSAVAYSTLQASAVTGNQIQDCSESNMYKFFNDETYATKWQWLLEYIISAGKVHPSRQAKAILGDGTAYDPVTNEPYDTYVKDNETQNQMNSLYHLSSSIASFFNGDASRPTEASNDVVFSATLYAELPNYNKCNIVDETPTLTLKNSEYMLSSLSKNGYDFNGYKLSNSLYTESFINDGSYGMLTPSFSPIAYNITYMDKETVLTELAATYTIESNTIQLASYSPENGSFIAWYDNPEFSGDPITSISAGTIGNKVFYAYTIEEQTSTITFDYMDPMTRLEIMTEFKADVYDICTNDVGSKYTSYSSKFLSTEGHSWGNDYLSLGVALSESSSFRTKWAWLFKVIAEAHGKAEGATDDIVEKIKALADDHGYTAYSQYDATTVYVFCQEMKGFGNVKQAIAYSSNTNYDWATDSENQYTAVYKASQTPNYTVKLVVGESLTIPQFTINGFKFTGWYTTVDYQEGTNISVVPENDCTVYAKWEDILFDINYELDGGTLGENSPVEYTAGIGVSLVNPTKLGYEFLGWSLVKNATEYITSISLETTGNITLYANWKDLSGEVKVIELFDADINAIASANPTKYVNSMFTGGTYVFNEEEHVYGETAFGSLTEALADSVDNDVIYVFAGTYNETITIDTNNVSIVGPNYNISAVDSSVTRNDEANIAGLLTISANSVTLNGIGLTGTSTAITVTACDDLAIKNVNCEGYGTNGSYQSVIYSSAAINGLTIENSYFCAEVAKYRAIRLTGCVTNPVINNNILKTNTSSNGIAITLGNIAGEVSISNNTIYYYTSNYSIYIGDTANTATLITISNNVIKGDSTTTTSGVGVLNASASCVVNFIKNEIYYMSGNLFSFKNSVAGSQINIMYNYFDSNTSFQLSTVGSGEIITNYNCYAGGFTTVDGGHNPVVTGDTKETTYEDLSSLKDAISLLN